jgi:hypothetical protein
MSYEIDEKALQLTGAPRPQTPAKPRLNGLMPEQELA